MAQVVTLSSVGTATMFLNPVAKATTVQFVTTTTSGTFNVDLTLDDPTTTPAPTVTWTLLSSAAILNSTTVAALTWTVLTPIGGLRINSTGAVTGGTHTLKALQSVTA